MDYFLDYLLGLRLVTAFSVIGLAIILGSKFYHFSECQVENHSSGMKKPNVSSGQGKDGKPKRLKEDFWEGLSSRR